MSDVVGFVGLGTMGNGMAANLLRRGHDLRIHARRDASAQAAVAAGAVRCASLAELGGACDVVFLCLPTIAEVSDVLFGEGGLAASLKPGSVVIDTSTIASTDAVRVAGELAALGVGALDAPVSGGPKGAADGTLACMVGGPEALVERCRPLLDAIAGKIVHVGEAGAGQLCKACNQICVAAAMLSASEVVALCRNAGVDPLRVREALLAGSARSAVLETHVMRLLEPTDAVGFRVELMLKDIRVALDTLRALGVFAPTTTVAGQMLGSFADTGHGAEDWTRIGMLIQDLSRPPEG